MILIPREVTAEAHRVLSDIAENAVHLGEQNYRLSATQMEAVLRALARMDRYLLAGSER